MRYACYRKRLYHVWTLHDLPLLSYKTGDGQRHVDIVTLTLDLYSVQLFGLLQIVRTLIPPSLMTVRPYLVCYGELCVSALWGLVPFDFMILKLKWYRDYSRGMCNLKSNFKVSTTLFRSWVMFPVDIKSKWTWTRTCWPGDPNLWPLAVQRLCRNSCSRCLHLPWHLVGIQPAIQWRSSKE